MKKIFFKRNWEKRVNNTYTFTKSNLHLLNNSIINNKNIKINPYKIRDNESGNIKYISPVSKEWNNTIYQYNDNLSKNLPVNNININSIIKHYFNLRFIPKFLKKKYKPRWVRRPSMNKIYISNTEVKHTNSNAIITIYTFNTEKFSL